MTNSSSVRRPSYGADCLGMDVHEAQHVVQADLGAPTILALLLIVAIGALGVFAPVRGDLVIRSRDRRLIVVRVPTPPVLPAAIFRLRLIVHIAGCQHSVPLSLRRTPASFGIDTVRGYKSRPRHA